MKIFIQTFGCQMNVRDSEALFGLFLEKGHTSVDNSKEADVILLNTCSVRAHAEHRVRSILGALKKVHSRQSTVHGKGKNCGLRTVDCGLMRPIIGLIGCMARNQGQDIFKRMPHVDLIVGPAKLHKIPEYVGRLQAASHKLQALGGNIEKQNNTDFKKSLQPVALANGGQTTAFWPGACSLERLRIIDVDDDARDEMFYDAGFRAEKDHAQVVISTGCSNYCSYCVVPHVRGELRLRSPEDIIAEVKRNVALGIKKITLLGQNVNDYSFIEAETRGYQRGKTRNRSSSQRSGRPLRGGFASLCTPSSFIDLLQMVEEIEGVKEIDFLTLHPKNTSKALFRLMAKSKKIKKYLHLPYQSGSDRILKLMNRGYTRDEYLTLVDDYKTIVGGTLGTDVIVGFPTETDEDFQDTKDILERVKFIGAYLFKYSPRPHTAGVEFADDVPRAVKEKRHRILLDLQKKISSGKK